VCAHLFLFDAQTGRTRAQLPLGDNNFSTNSEWVLSWPAKGRLLRAWSISENRLRWERRMPFDGCKASVETRHVFVSCPGHVEMRRWSDGQRLWRAKGTTRGHSDELVLVERDHRLRVLDVETGKKLFGRPTRFEQVCLLGDFFYGITHAKLVRLDAWTGATITEGTLSGLDPRLFCADSVRPDQPEALAEEPRLPVMQEPGAPLVTTVPGALIAYDPETLAQLWRYPLTDPIIPREFTLAASRDVVALSDSGWSMGLDARTGVTLWGTAKPQGSALPASVEPLVLLKEDRCSVYASDARTGQELWQRDFGRDLARPQAPPINQ
jgi:outer membrane protein assembly factor BamB